MNPNKRQQKLEEARRACNAGDAAGAERICQALLRVNRADLPALHMLGVIAAWRQDYGAAQGWFERCVALVPRDVAFMRELARVHTLAGRYEAALTHLQRAADLQPGNKPALADLADVLERSGQAARAWAVLGPFVEAGTADADMALVAARVLDRLGRTEPALALARQCLAAAGGEDSTRRFLLQLQGRLLDKTGDARGAFQAFAQAKQLERHPFVAADFAREIDALIAAFSAQALARLPRGRQDAAASELPVFIACMPRSGSTLVEQVIHAHPMAQGGGETPLLHEAIVGLPAMLGTALPYPHCVAALDAATVDRLAAQILRDTAALAPGAARVTHKHLLNWLHLGMVSVLFPGARVIHIRRDRLDNGLACFMTSLSPALMPWAGDLGHIGFAWRQYERLMAHWRATLDLRLLDVSYEDLVDDTEAQIRRIIDFCGLPWDEHCLRYWEAERVVLTPSYDQVRQPIFSTAKGRWQRYEEFLAPLKAALA
jgi:tetratricopeptide (TPR) repeat protein